MIRPEFIIEELRTNMPDADFDMVWRAYAFAARCHKGQKRQSGEPYLNHPLEVAYLLAKMKLGHVSISVGLLHDTIEDTFATPEEIQEMFGDEVLHIVDGVTKISLIDTAIDTISSEERQAENVRKMILAMAKDIRVILVKLADRLHNMRTLDALKPAKQRQIAQETLDIYAPLANRLGIGGVKTELENTCFKYLWPREYSETKHKVEELEAEREGYLKEVVSQIQERLIDEDIRAEVKGRSKHLYSIFHKMRRQQISFEEVFDILAIRIITPTDTDCYSLLGVVHNMYKPIPGKLKDYIALPKANFYQSLHTTIVGPKGKPVEIQIRSERMDVICEEGIAAHWRYKEGKATESKHDEQISWVRRLLEWQTEVKDPREFLEKVKIDLFPDEVYVFTPAQEVKSFPQGATPIDFAYSVHTDVGAHCVGARINGKLASLKHPLRNGDIVEILTSSQAHPSRDWLKIVTTSKARAKISAYLHQAERSRAQELGREILEKEIAQLLPDIGGNITNAQLEEYAKAVGHNSVDSMWVALGMGKLKPLTILSKFHPKPAEAATVESITRRPTQVRPASGGVRIQDVDDLLIRFAQCCNPVPGDAIVGFISRGRGLIVHTAECPNSTGVGVDSERYVAVEWDLRSTGKHLVMLAIKSEDRPGILGLVSVAIADKGGNITEATIRRDSQGRGDIFVTLEVADLAQLQSIMYGITQQPGIINVDRIRDRRAFTSKIKKKAKGN